jgi:hypothetical protein
METHLIRISIRIHMGIVPATSRGFYTMCQIVEKIPLFVLSVVRLDSLTFSAGEKPKEKALTRPDRIVLSTSVVLGWRHGFRMYVPNRDSEGE